MSKFQMFQSATPLLASKNGAIALYQPKIGVGEDYLIKYDRIYDIIVTKQWM